MTTNKQYIRLGISNYIEGCMRIMLENDIELDINHLVDITYHSFKDYPSYKPTRDEVGEYIRELLEWKL